MISKYSNDKYTLEYVKTYIEGVKKYYEQIEQRRIHLIENEKNCKEKTPFLPKEGQFYVDYEKMIDSLIMDDEENYSLKK